MDVLPLQGSAVPCERVFSSAKETITNRRNLISPPLFEALQMLKFALRHDDPLDFTSFMNITEETLDLEAILEVEGRVPDDVNAFIKEFMRI